MNNFLQTIYLKDITPSLQSLNIITSYGNDTEDNQASVTDPKGSITQYYNESLGRDRISLPLMLHHVISQGSAFLT